MVKYSFVCFLSFKYGFSNVCFGHCLVIIHEIICHYGQTLLRLKLLKNRKIALFMQNVAKTLFSLA